MYKQYTFPCSDDNQLVKFYHESRSMMNCIVFFMRECKLNSTKLKGIVQWADSHSAAHSRVPLTKTMVVGLSWNTYDDILSVEMHLLKFSKSVTKRMVLSAPAKMFDPLGWLLPNTVNGKILIQDLWREKFGGIKFSANNQLINSSS